MNDLAPAPGVGEFPYVVDSTMLNDWRLCPQRAFNAHILCLVGGPSIHLHAGAAFAKGLEATRLAFWQDGLRPRSALEAGWVALTKYWGEVDWPTKNKNWLNVSCAFFRYFDTFPLDRDPLRPILYNERVAVEWTFAIPTAVAHPATGLPVLYGGRLDALVEDGKDFWPLDDKTTERTPAGDYMKQWLLRAQFIGYTFACRYHNIPVRGAWVRTTVILKTDTRFLQAPIFYDDWLIEQWWHGVNRTVAEMVQAFDRWKLGTLPTVDIFPKDFGDACSAYGGCGYLGLCTSKNPETWHGSFHRSRWNPVLPNPRQDLVPTPVQVDAHGDEP